MKLLKFVYPYFAIQNLFEPKTVIMKKLAFYLALIAILFLQTDTVDAQETPDSTIVYQIETYDGNVFIGTIISRNDNTIVFKTEKLGTLNVPFNNVKEIKEV